MIATHRLGSMLENLGPNVSWDDSRITLERPFDVLVDWADDGVLFLPCTALVGQVLFTAERPQIPALTYAAWGIAPLLSPPARPSRSADLGELTHPTRVAILELLDEPRTTQDLGRLDGHSTATVSHHLAVLRLAGLVASRRNGRGVVYRRTALGML